MALARALEQADFYSHIPCGMWHNGFLLHSTNCPNFYSHIPCGMWRSRNKPAYAHRFYFYSHIPCGMWLSCLWFCQRYFQFLLTHPVWDVTICFISLFMKYFDFYSHIPCGMWLWRRRNRRFRGISTHTSRVGCDGNDRNGASCQSNFYSHIPCGMWRHEIYWHRDNWLYFYSHIPCGMWPLYIVYYSLSIPIYHEMDL